MTSFLRDEMGNDAPDDASLRTKCRVGHDIHDLFERALKQERRACLWRQRMWVNGVVVRY